MDQARKGAKWQRVVILIPSDTVRVFIAAVARIESRTKLHHDPAIKYGQVVEILSANYLAGP